jgi:hypothetical protein
MTTITSYKELRQEKARLEAMMLEQKVQIKQEWQVIREDLRPSLNLAATVKKALTRRASGAVTNLGINLMADGLVRNVLLAKSGGISRWVIPFLVKNYASHLVGEPEKLMNKIKSLFRKKTKGDEKVDQQPVERVAPQEAGIEAV